MCLRNRSFPALRPRIQEVCQPNVHPETPIPEESEILETLRLTPRVRDLSDAAQARCAALVRLLLEANRRVNLTAIRTVEGVALSHLADSLAALEAAPELREAEAADIGSGAGFPAFPLAIAAPQSNWTAIESVAKKARFIEETAAALKLANVRAVALRAEDAGRGDLRGVFDAATARAVGATAALCEVGLPLVREGGLLLLFKTGSAREDIAAGLRAARKLGGTADGEFAYTLPGDAQQRLIIRVRKTGPTPPDSPRRAGIPFRNPLA